MSKRYLLILLILSCFSYVSMGQLATATPILSSTDTLFVQVDAQFNKFIVHKIKKGETLFSISKFYGLKLDNLYFFNPGIKDQVISIGTKVKIPLENKDIVRIWDNSFDKSHYAPVYYAVRRGETMYTISRSYFSVTPVLLQKNNKKSTWVVSDGEKLIIGWMSLEGVTFAPGTANAPEVWGYKANTALRTKYNQYAEIKVNTYEDGIAIWQRKDNTETHINFFALHRKAPINSVIKITNPMTKRTFYAKVTGRIPRSTYDRNVKVVISPSLAKAFGAIDPKFHVKIEYLR